MFVQTRLAAGMLPLSVVLVIALSWSFKYSYLIVGPADVGVV